MKLAAFFIRHGETDMNNPPDGSEEKFRGDADVPLNMNGHQQAEDLVQYLKGYKLSALYHSGKHRTMQTMMPLAEDKGLPSVALKNFDSLDTGEFTGLPKNEENKEKLAYYREHPDETIPGGESVNHFRDRVDPIIRNCVKIGLESGAPVAACVHGSVMREISRLFDESYDSLKVEPGGIVGIAQEQDGSLTAMPLVKESEEEEDMDRPGS
jgi:2,3-bisphosphoglycerate-dependent phosphoglycerate mutase